VTVGHLLLRYGLFALLATLTNLAAQRVVLDLLEGRFALPAAIGCGTIAGLVLKYVLDRRWIFQQKAALSFGSAAEFARYTATGIFTTCLFWGTESGAWLWFGTDRAREVGAVLGLGGGYVVKYHLDKKYVFARAS